MREERWLGASHRGDVLDAGRWGEDGFVGEFPRIGAAPVLGLMARDDQNVIARLHRQLADAGLIARCGVYVDGKFYPKTVTNAGGNPIGVYTVKQPSLARALIRAHAPATLGAVKQTELVLV